MIDVDGIERPVEFDGHEVPLHKSRHPYKITSKTYARPNAVVRGIRGILKLAASFFLRLYAYFILGIRVREKKSIKQIKKEGGVIVCNHAHYLDLPLIYAHIIGNEVKTITLRSNLDIPFVRHILLGLGALPVPDERKDMMTFVGAVNDALNANKFVSFAAEGSLWPYYRGVRPFKISAFRFAGNAFKPVLPVAVTFKLKEKTTKKGVKRKYKTTITFLSPIRPAEELSPGDRAFDLLERTREAIQEKVNENGFDKNGK